MTDSLLEGVLPIWKPTGMTSHDVVAKLRRILGMKRIGHTGTLDPSVVGVLPICIGRATRIAEYIQVLPKTYDAVLRFGVATDTGDLDGQIMKQLECVPVLDEQHIRETLSRFQGLIEQIPPMYSAVKVKGKRLYELARQGVEVERKARQVEIFDIQLTKSNLNLPFPEIHF